MLFRAKRYDISQLSEEGELSTNPSKEGSPPVGRLSLYPPTAPYREPYFFPEAAPLRPPSDKVRDVTLYDTYYSPSLLFVSSGMTIRWKNCGKHHHTITCNWLWESGEMKTGDSFSLKFTRVGTYKYSCRLHPQYMRGKIVVYY
jgi:plastocyanin